MSNHHAIGVFDSGVGGLTVYKALKDLLPHEDFVYLGDTARLPYGTKSIETISQYALQAAQFLINEKIKLLVVACNTASALALPSLQKALPHLPALGVIEPSAAEAALHSRNGKIAVLATESTVRSGAYKTAIAQQRPGAEVTMLACNLLVAMAEEGWCEGKEAEIILSRYLRELPSDIDTLVLGCTHFPLLAPTLRKLLPDQVTLIDSAHAMARCVTKFLNETELNSAGKKTPSERFLVTDSPERFAAMAENVLKANIASQVTFAYLSPQSAVTTQHPQPAKAS